MQLKRYSSNPILTRNPQNHWEAGSVFNPCVWYEDGIFRMVYRATNDIQINKPRGYISSIGYAESIDGIHFTRSSKPIITPDQPYENYKGCEDPRVTKIDDTYFLYYTAVSGEPGAYNVRIALATSKNLKTWKKHGIVGPDTRSKAACLFPEKINGKYVLFYTWMADRPVSSIMQVRFNSIKEILKPPKGLIAQSLNHYDKHVVFMPPVNTYRGAEVGAVPIKTKYGWLFIYCNANTSDHPEWTIKAALLDLNDPGKILAQSNGPILRPEATTEVAGVVNNVTFPEGAVVMGKELYVYYGSGDQGICLATCNLTTLLRHLTLRIVKKGNS
jgi:predicted GH43/DUF377 family glycosyl hydrolase